MIKRLPSKSSCTVCILGLGYVGLPLTLTFANSEICERTSKRLSRKIIGFDSNENRINQLNNFFDINEEVHSNELKISKNILFTYDKKILREVDIFIITVPTPINNAKQPDLELIKKASEFVGEAIKYRNNRSKSNPIIIYESTFYPGLTEEFCIPILESNSGLEYNLDKNEETFYCGYSPERINPGDKSHTINTIKKVVSGCNDEVSTFIEYLYGSVIQAGVFKASSIKVAEAAKVIENTQRDLNIALINELTIIFEKMNIDTLDVLEAAGTKWNFLPFKPGLVGGHCIGIDPYYLTYKSQVLGYHPELVLAGRRINDNMSKWISKNLIKELCNRSICPSSSKILILGFTFKENCKDIRNTKIIDIVEELREFEIKTTIVDPLGDKDQAKEFYNVNILNSIPQQEKFDAILLAVNHKDFNFIDENFLKKILKENGFAYDLKGQLPRIKNVKRI